MSTIGNASGRLSLHTQVSSDIVGSKSGVVSKSNIQEGSRKKNDEPQLEDKKNRTSNLKEQRTEENRESRSTEVDRELQEKMIKGDDSSQPFVSQLHSQIQGNPGSLASMQLSKLSMHNGMKGVHGRSKEDSMQAFEAYMVQMMMKEMRKTLPKGAFGSNSMDMFMDMFDQAIAEQLAQRGGIGISETLDRQFQSHQDSTTGNFAGHSGFSRSNQDQGETSSFGQSSHNLNSQQSLESRQIAAKLNKMGISSTHLETFQQLYQTWKNGEKIDSTLMDSSEQEDGVWKKFVASPSFQSAAKGMFTVQSPQVDISQERLINQMIVDEISLGMMDSSYDNINSDMNSILGIERIYGLNFGMYSQDPWKLQQILGKDVKTSTVHHMEHEKTTEHFEGGIEDFYNQDFYNVEHEGYYDSNIRNPYQDLQNIQKENIQKEKTIRAPEISSNIKKQSIAGMSSNEMKDVFHSISKQHVIHSQVSSTVDNHVMIDTDIQPFIPDRRELFSLHSENTVAQKNKSETGVYQFPVKGMVSSHFGMRLHPISHTHKHHDGMDIAASQGTSIQPISEGIVISSGINGGYGNVVVIEHDDGLTSMYAHCDQLLVQVGERVFKDTTIATVGSTGVSTGPHLHLEIRKEGALVNPAYYIGQTSDEQEAQEQVSQHLGPIS